MEDEWEIKVFGFTPKKDEVGNILGGFEHEDADAILASVVKHLRAEGHTLTRVELSHGAIRGGARKFDLTQEAASSEELTAEVTTVEVAATS